MGMRDDMRRVEMTANMTGANSTRDEGHFEVTVDSTWQMTVHTHQLITDMTAGTGKEVKGVMS